MFFSSDPSSILGGVRLPPDTEIIKYTSSIVGPKVPGTTNRGRKKTISLDTPSVSVHPPPVPALSAHQTNTTSSSSLMIEPRKYNRTVRSAAACVGRNSEIAKHKITKEIYYILPRRTFVLSRGVKFASSPFITEFPDRAISRVIACLSSFLRPTRTSTEIRWIE